MRLDDRNYMRDRYRTQQGLGNTSWKTARRASSMLAPGVLAIAASRQSSFGQTVFLINSTRAPSSGGAHRHARCLLAA